MTLSLWASLGLGCRAIEDGVGGQCEVFCEQLILRDEDGKEGEEGLEAC
jgi:hypothetical protein